MMHRTARRKRLTFYLPAHVDQVLETASVRSGRTRSDIARCALIEALLGKTAAQPSTRDLSCEALAKQETTYARR